MELTIKIQVPTSKYGIFMEPDVHKKLDAIIQECGSEVGWICLMERVGKWEFHIKDIFIPSQQASAVTTDIDHQAIGELECQMWDEGKISMENQMTTGLYMWGHSHVNMSTSPSSQDISQFRDLIKNKPPYFIRMIANKKGEFTNDLYINDETYGEIKLSSVPISVLDDRMDEIRESIRKELKEKVRKEVYTYKYPRTKATLGRRGKSLYPDIFPDTGRYKVDFEAMDAAFNKVTGKFGFDPDDPFIEDTKNSFIRSTGDDGAPNIGFSRRRRKGKFQAP